MIDNYKFNRKLNELYRRKDRLHKAYAAEKSGKSGDVLRSLESQEELEACEYEESISLLVTD